MRVKVIIFDFDGTLVDSNEIKYRAFFDLFAPNTYDKTVIEDVLKKYGEESRYFIIEKILSGIGENDEKQSTFGKEIARYAEKYNSMIIDLVKRCEEKRNASKILELLHGQYRLYLSSTTPEFSLKKIIKFRQWDKYFTDIFGYPKDKVATVEKIMKSHAISPADILIVGDGGSDRQAAKHWGCFFYPVSASSDLLEIAKLLT